MGGTGDSEARDTLSGTVHGRDDDGHVSSPESRRRPRLLRQSHDATDYEHPHVLCFAARNRRGRFYIPLTTNNFGGIAVNHVLLDSGCSTLLLPFPISTGFPTAFLSARYKWIVSSSRGTGAVHSPVLKIKLRLGGEFPLTLAGKDQPHIEFLRFHLGSEAVNQLLNNQGFRNMLDDSSINKLNDFRSALGDMVSPERTYALLGQSYFSRVMYCQLGDVALAFAREYDGSDNVVEIMANYERKLEPLVEAFEGFHDLEDDDGDEDEEEYRLSWDTSSEGTVDEPDPR